MARPSKLPLPSSKIPVVKFTGWGYRARGDIIAGFSPWMLALVMRSRDGNAVVALGGSVFR